MATHSGENKSLNNVLLICEASTNTEGFTRLFDSYDFSVDIRHDNLQDNMELLYTLQTPLSP
ncbi:hypothetical protein L3V31_13980 [Vibrio sp. J1-1]|uniref:hypothetical protein n=1 Tax=Vibrio sp. J1-1 TaxID=2912251 RepID=UPI001F1DADAD|nr:hypothetical protein [Vibrio sp. J1-1]MCF7482820.1 hypothetical protein [Vibrio sp. J1-1]